MREAYLFKAFTRTPMKFGIPIIPLLIVGGVGTCLSFMINPILLIFVAAALLAMRWAAAIDDHIFHQLYMEWYLNRRSNSNRLHWHRVVSFAPKNKRGTKEIISEPKNSAEKNYEHH